MTSKLLLADAAWGSLSSASQSAMLTTSHFSPADSASEQSCRENFSAVPVEVANKIVKFVMFFDWVADPENDDAFK